MKKSLMIFILIMMNVMPLPGQTAEEIKVELSSVEDLIRQGRLEAMQSEEIKQLRDAVDLSEKEYKEAVSSLPGIQELDNEMAQLRRQLMDLQRKRTEIETRKSGELQQKRDARDSAQKMLREKMMGENYEALMKRRSELLALLKAVTAPAE